MTDKAIGIMPENKPEEDVPKGKMHFFGIGIDKYEHWQNLRNAVNDVEGIEKILHEYYDFDKNNMVILKNEKATRSAIVNRLHAYTASNALSEHDSLLIYFSGHGYLDENDNGYWAPVDSETNGVASFVANEEILKSIKNMKCLHVLLISDSCYSGSLKMKGAPLSLENLVATTLAKKKSRWLLTSGDRKEVVADGVGKHSPFAEAILSELQHNDQSLLIADELAIEVRKIALNNAKQMAQFQSFPDAGDLGGRFVFRKKLSDKEKQENSDWESAFAQHTEGRYQNYLDIYPNGKYRKQAIAALEKVRRSSIPPAPPQPRNGLIEFILKLGRLKIAITLFSVLGLVIASNQIIQYYANKKREELAAIEETKRREKEAMASIAKAHLEPEQPVLHTKPQTTPSTQTNTAKAEALRTERERKAALAAQQQSAQLAQDEVIRRKTEIRKMLVNVKNYVEGDEVSRAVSTIIQILDRNEVNSAVKNNLKNAKVYLEEVPPEKAHALEKIINALSNL